jgi:hypothetical protein
MGDQHLASAAVSRWPSAAKPGDSEVLCVVTRFGVRSPLDILRIFVHYRRVRRAARHTGLLQSAFLIENVRTCYTLSIWRDLDAIGFFGTRVTEHVDAGNSVFAWLRRTSRGPEVWSTTWRLSAASDNLNWGSFDLRRVLNTAPKGMPT